MHNSLENYLAASDGVGSILEHIRVIARLNAIYPTLLPESLTALSRVANCNAGTVTIFADNNAIAAKIRQFAPSLQEGFARKGVDCTELKVKIQTPDLANPPPFSSPKELSQTAQSALTELHQQLADSPLRASIENLLLHAAKTQ